MPNSRSRWAGGFVEVVLPLRSQNVVLRLSPLDKTVRSLMSKHWLSTSRWRRPPASSRSELEIVPVGFLSVTSLLTMNDGHLYRQRSGLPCTKPSRGEMWFPRNHTPPAPIPDASWCPSAAGSRGMSSAIRVGRDAMLLCIHRKSSKASWTPLLRATRPPVLADRACCMVLKMLRDPGSANAMDLSSPRMECHFLTLVRRWVGGMEARISARRSTRWGGSWMVMFMVSTIQPKMSFNVPQEQSPSRSFLIDTGSCRVGLSVGKSGWKTSSMECKRALRTRRRFSRSG